MDDILFLLVGELGLVLSTASCRYLFLIVSLVPALALLLSISGRLRPVRPSRVFRCRYGWRLVLVLLLPRAAAPPFHSGSTPTTAAIPLAPRIHRPTLLHGLIPRPFPNAILSLLLLLLPL